LRNDYKKAFEEDKAARATILSGLTLCAAKECLQLTDLMYRKLPSELRDLVYRFLCIEDQVIAIGPNHLTRGGSSNNELAIGLSHGRILIDHSERPDPAIVAPQSHIFNETYMGQAIAFEARMVYLANNTFSVCNVAHNLAEFLVQYQPNVGFVDMFPPCSNNCFPPVTPFGYVRKLQIRTRYDGDYGPHMSNFPGALPVYWRETFANECDCLRRSNAALGVLLMLPQGTQPLELELIILTSFSEYGSIVAGAEVPGHSREFINILQALRNTFYVLKHDRKNTEIKIIHHDEFVSPFPRDITLLWSLSKEQWEYVRFDLVPFLALLQTLFKEHFFLQTMYTSA
jgi:hypothetical protein